MKKIIISDATLTRQETLSFKEKLEISRYLYKTDVNVIELGEIACGKADILLVKTISSIAKDAVISVGAGKDLQSVDDAVTALQNTNKKRIRIELPVSSVGMEYTFHKKAPKMLLWAEEVIKYAKSKIDDVELYLSDATRADKDFVAQMIETGVKNGVTLVTLSDEAGVMMPDEFGSFIGEFASSCSVPVFCDCSDKNGLATSQALLAVKNGASGIKTSLNGDDVNLEVFANLVKNCGQSFGIESSIRQTEIHRLSAMIKRILKIDNSQGEIKQFTVENSAIKLNKNDDKETVVKMAETLGYELSEEDENKVYEEFCRVAEKKNVGAKELDAIVASVAMQVPSTYQLKNYLVTSGNVMTAQAQILLDYKGEVLQGVCMGDGPIDASIKALELLIGKHFDLDDFQIQSVTEGKEAMGFALVKLRKDGKIYSGNGISTDIIGASIRAYVVAVNKIVYEEENV